MSLRYIQQMRLFFITLSLLTLSSPLFAAEPISPRASIYARMDEEEKKYYNQIFSYAMSTLKAKESYPWKTYGASGSIHADAMFASQQGYTCRPFSENITVRGEPAETAGIACARQGRPGWCRLKEGNALTCAMEPPQDMQEELGDKAREAVQGGESVLDKVWKLF